MISEDWSSDCRRDVPYLARIAEAGGLELRIFTRDGDTMLMKGLPEPGAGGNGDLVREFANEKKGQKWATVPVAVFFTEDFRELYRYIEYPAIYHKERLIGHLRAARASESDDQSPVVGPAARSASCSTRLSTICGPSRRSRRSSAPFTSASPRAPEPLYRRGNSAALARGS